MAPSDGSRTIIVSDSNPREEGDGGASGTDCTDARGRDRVDGVLMLRGGRRTRPRVAWSEDVVDNEGMGKKKSKSELIFCFHCSALKRRT